MIATYGPKTTPWQIGPSDFPSDGDLNERMLFLLRYAILAPSSHNTQPWKFTVEGNEIRILIDKSRWLRTADSDQRELHISIGCALQNLLVAAEHFGYDHVIDYMPDPGNDTLAAIVTLREQRQPSAGPPTPLFGAITKRHTNHNEFNGEAIPAENLTRLQGCCAEEGILLHLTGDPSIKRKVDDLISRADAIQFADPAWREELGYWLGKGGFGTSWLMSKLGQLAVTYLNMSKQTARKDSELLMSAPVLGVISARTDDRVVQIKVGRGLERMSLMAASLGIAVHPMSQILEIPEIRNEVAGLIPESDVVPQHTFRLGYAEPEKAHTPRRPLDEVMLK